ncbi:hypothetical protein F5Y01DRAFT_327089 [Xylaria sp. FL0043]|nr:hypothetical protein F5Y01DRAFT_327089 [Xylaria sp. FL0043]
MPSPPGTLIGSFSHNTGGQVDVVLETIILGLDYLSLGLRLWSRAITKTRWQVNDWLIIAATILMTARYVVEVIAILKCGVGLHIEEVTAIGGPGVLVLFTQLLYIVDLLWATIVTLLKLSILHFYTVLFPQRSFHRYVYVAMMFCVIFWFGSFFGTAFLCRPPQKKWDPSIPGQCSSEITQYVAIVAGDLLTDLIIIALPMPLLSRLHLPIGQKIPVMLAFGLGFAITTITSVRIKYFLHLDTSDPLYSIWPDAVLSAIVPLLGILNANLLVSRPALKAILHTSTTPKNRPDIERGSHQFQLLGDTAIPLYDVSNELNHHPKRFVKSAT